MSDPKRKFPLTLHRTGQYCKKIRGKTYYFGKDRAEALRLYYSRASELHAGKPAGTPAANSLTLEDLCNMYLFHQLGRTKTGEIKCQQYNDQKGRLRTFADAVGRDRLIRDVKTIDLMNYRNQRIDAGRAPVTINNELAVIKAMYHWALDAEVIDRGPNLDAVKKIPRRKKVKRQTFTPDEIRALMAKANPQWRAMILLGLNCGFGCTDVAELRWANVNLGAGRVCFPRPKTAVERDFPLWPETVAALKLVPVRGECVFYTRNGQTWGYRDKGKYEVKPLTVAFKMLLKRAGVHAEKGTGFYTLRRTAATIGAQTGDVFAVQGILGHADLAMASTYVQQHKLNPQVDRAIEHTRQWLADGATNPEDSE